MCVRFDASNWAVGTHPLISLRPRAVFAFGTGSAGARLTGLREEVSQGVGHPVPADAVATLERQAELQVRGQRHLQGPGATSRIRAVTCSPNASTVLPAVKTRGPGRTICGEMLQARAPCRLLERGDRLPAARHEGHGPIATCAHLTTPRTPTPSASAALEAQPRRLSFSMSVRPVRFVRVVRPVRLVRLRA